jgi:hypothetical protein
MARKRYKPEEIECNPAKHLALRLCSGQTLALPESDICLKQTWVDFINSVRPRQAPVAERPDRAPAWAGRAMPASPIELREFAQECLRSADETKSERHREVLLNMAKNLMEAALQLERSLALIDDDARPLRPKIQASKIRPRRRAAR